MAEWYNQNCRTITSTRYKCNFRTSSASFYWQLLTEEGHQVANGNLGISGEQYDAWGADDDYVYTIIATDLSLVIVEPSEEASA